MWEKIDKKDCYNFLAYKAALNLDLSIPVGSLAGRGRAGMAGFPFGFHRRPLLLLRLEQSVAGRVADGAAASAQTVAGGLELAHFMGLDLGLERFGGGGFAGLKVRFITEHHQAVEVVSAAATTPHSTAGSPMVTPLGRLLG